MYKYLLFSEPKSLVFYSSATAIDRFDSYLFATTKMCQLIFRENSANATKASINLKNTMKLAGSESLAFMKVIRITRQSSDQIGQKNPINDFRNLSPVNIKSKNVSSNLDRTFKSVTAKILIGTSKLNFYVLTVDLISKKVTNCESIVFSYKSSLKRLTSNSKIIPLSDGKVLLLIANFIFYWTPFDTRFRLLKILKEKAISVEIDYDFENEKKIYILCKKHIIFGEIMEMRNGTMTFQESKKELNKRKFKGMKAMRKKLIFFNKEKQLRVYELDKQIFTYKVEFMQGFKQSFDYKDVHVINGDILTFHDSKYLYCLSLKMNRVWQVVNVSDSHYVILPDGKVLTLQSQSENLFSIANLTLKTYQKHNKINKYLALKNPIEKVRVIFAYLAKKFLKMFRFGDFNKVIYKLLLKMNLSDGLVKTPEFKPEVLKLYNLIRDFSVKSHTLSPPDSPQSLTNISGNSCNASLSPCSSSMRELPSETASDQPESISSSSSVSRHPLVKPPKTLNYMVVKPFVNIQLPRKNAEKKDEDESVHLQKIALKGRKHYQKFLLFRTKDAWSKDCIDSVYARFQTRLQQIQSGKLHIQSIVKYFIYDFQSRVEALFFFSKRFLMKNNIKLLHSIFIGIDSYMWCCAPERMLHYRVIKISIQRKLQFDQVSSQERKEVSVDLAKHSQYLLN